VSTLLSTVSIPDKVNDLIILAAVYNHDILYQPFVVENHFKVTPLAKVSYDETYLISFSIFDVERHQVPCNNQACFGSGQGQKSSY
jgi:hypothetical protein